MPFWKRNPPAETWLVVGLGNPGEKYARNHHNIGFMCLDRFAADHRVALGRSRSRAKEGRGKIAGKDVIAAKPMTFMNLSGEAVGSLLQRHHVKPENLIVVHDDMDLPQGKIRVRHGGSAAGHNGIKSIVEHVGTEDFTRVRVGIGHPPAEAGERRDVIDYVLGDFSREEQAVMEKVMPVVSEAIEATITGGVIAAMNKYNRMDMSQ